MIGRSLSHYDVLEQIGRGGMGEIYLAHDRKLSRKVALKVLPPELAQDRDRRSRFEREAKAVAALNHPNIVTVYSVEQAEGVHFITMELVRGKTLSELLPTEGFSLDRFFDVAIPVTDAMAAAHERGITHRDIKPDNVMQNDEGRIKILDFGLAKVGSEQAASFMSDFDTLSGTREGWVVGTVHYMSPEQAEGKPVDHRSDIFALGVLFYEILSGTLPFTGDTPAGVVSSILKDEPLPLSLARKAVPRELESIVSRCLQKARENRFQTTAELRDALSRCRASLVASASEPRHGRGVRNALALAILLAASGIGFAIRALVDVNEADSLPTLSRPRQITTAVGVEAYPTFSPDGSRIAYAALAEGNNWDIWVRQLSGGAAVNLTADHPGPDLNPSWSPDGSTIAFSSSREGGGCFVMPALGGAPRKITSSTSLPEQGHPAWSSTGAELACLAKSDTLRITDIETEEYRELPVPDFPGRAYDLDWSPNGKHFALVEAPSYQAPVTRLWQVGASDGRATPLSDGNAKLWGPRFAADGSLFYVTNAGGAMDLWRQRFDDDANPMGEPVAVTVALGLYGRASFSPDGSMLAYASGRLVANIWRVPVLAERAATWEDAQGLSSEQAYVDSLDVCADPPRLVFSSDRSGNLDLWTMPSDGGDARQLTSDPASAWGPAWSPECAEVAFHSDRSGNRDIWVVPVEPGPARQLTSRNENELDPRWSPDGKTLVFSSGSRPGQTWAVPAAGGDPVVLIDSGNQPDGWSPDGRWIVYEKHDGQRALWSVDESAEESLNFGSELTRWSIDGRHIFYLGGDGNIWSYTISDETTRPLTKLVGRPGKLGPYSLATDGDYVYFTWQLDQSDIWVMDVADSD